MQILVNLLKDIIKQENHINKFVKIMYILLGNICHFLLCLQIKIKIWLLIGNVLQFLSLFISDNFMSILYNH
jgi:hypothetical protein